MAHLTSVSGVQKRARRLIESFDSWEDGMVRQVLEHPDHAPSVVELKTLLPSLDSYIRLADELIKDAEFGTLSPEQQTDVRAIHEEMTIANTEVQKASDPDTVWQATSAQHKGELVQQERCDRRTASELHARIKLDKRRQRLGSAVVIDPDAPVVVAGPPK